MIARAKRARLGQGIPDSAQAALIEHQRRLLEQQRQFAATPRWKLKAIALLGFLGAAGVGAAATVLIQRWHG